MRNLFRIGMVLCILLGVVAGSVTMGEKSELPFSKEVSVAIYPNDPLIIIEDDQLDGYLVSLLEEVSNANNWKINYQVTDLAEGLDQVTQGKVDLMLGVAWSEERSKKYTFNEESVFVNWGQIYSNPNVTIESIQDLAGKRIGVYRNDIHYVGTNGLRNTLKQFGIQASFVEFEDKLDILTAIESGEVEVGIVNRTYGNVHSSGFQILKTAIQLNPVQLHVITGKAENQGLLDATDHVLSQWKGDQSSVYYNLLEKWFQEQAPSGVPYWMWYTVSFIVFLLAIALVVIYGTQSVIRRKTQELRELNDSLECRVKERTAEVDSMNFQLQTSLINLEEKQAELEEMNAILTEQIGLLERTQSQLVESEKMASLGRMTASLAHEMNTPLGVCVTLNSNLQVDTEEQREALLDRRLTKSSLVTYLDDVKATVEMFDSNLHSVVDLVSRFKMLSSDRTLHNERKVNLHSFLHMQMKSLSPELKHTNHRCSIQCPEDLETVIDPGAFSQVIRNLTMNSLLHGFDTMDKGNIEIQVERKGSKVVLQYDDDGKGIDPAIMNRVFEPFFTTKRNEGGTGLGLSITHSAVTQSLSGDIWIDRHKAKGVGFRIELPYREEEPPMFSTWKPKV